MKGLRGARHAQSGELRGEDAVAGGVACGGPFPHGQVAGAADAQGEVRGESEGGGMGHLLIR